MRSSSRAMTVEGRSNSLFGLLLRLLGHFSIRRRKQLLLLLLLIFISAVADIISLGAVLPFIGALTTPETLLERPSIQALARVLDIRSPDQLVLPLTIAFVVAALTAAAIRITVLWVSTRVAFGAGTELSIQAYRLTLYQPYQKHISRNSSVVISGIVDQVNGATAVLLVLLNFVSSLVFLCIAIITLIALQPFIALIAVAGFGLNYALILWPAKRILKRNSERIAVEQIRVIQTLQEGLGAIRDVILDNTQELYCRVYKSADMGMRGANAKTTFIGQSPKFVTEALGMIIIALVAYGFAVYGGLTAALPMLALLALGAQRLLPAMQQTYASWVGIAGSEAILVGALELLDQPVPKQEVQPATPLTFKSSIALDGVSFNYEGQACPAINDVSLTIAKGMRVGIVGISGSGKSTLMDLMLGLLPPTGGQVLLDGQPITEANVKQWQETIAHVPQSIFIADASIAENIAFGLSRDAIDMDRVKAVAEQVQIAELVESKSEGYLSKSGERGIQISGGQRQRIGLARALYKRAEVLFLDEPTAALDSLTESTVLQSLDQLSRDLTIIIIAHRLSTVQNCDRIYVVEQGRIVDSGSYGQLLTESESFRRLAMLQVGSGGRTVTPSRPVFDGSMRVPQ